MSLWLYATLDGVGSARLLDRLCESEAAYRWLCGRVSVNYHTLSDFRSDAGPVLDDLLSRSMVGLIVSGLVDVQTVAVDGVRVRASAGSGSFRSGERLQELYEATREAVEQLRTEVEEDHAWAARRTRARRKAVAEDRLRRLEEARRAHAEIEGRRQEQDRKQRRKKPRNDKPARASTSGWRGSSDLTVRQCSRSVTSNSSALLSAVSRRVSRSLMRARRCTAAANATLYSATGLSPSTYYWFRVQAYNVFNHPSFTMGRVDNALTADFDTSATCTGAAASDDGDVHRFAATFVVGGLLFDRRESSETDLPAQQCSECVVDTRSKRSDDAALVGTVPATHSCQLFRPSRSPWQRWLMTAIN